MSDQPPAPVPVRAPLRWPTYPEVLAGGLYGMSFWLLYILSPEKGAEPSDLFKTLATAVVLSAFVNGVVAAVFTVKHATGGAA